MKKQFPVIYDIDSMKKGFLINFFFRFGFHYRIALKRKFTDNFLGKFHLIKNKFLVHLTIPVFYARIYYENKKDF